MVCKIGSSDVKATLFVFNPWTFRSNGYCRCLRQSVCPSVCPSVRKLFLVRTITRHRFGLESPNLHQTCILANSQLMLNMEVIDFDLQGHFGHFDCEFYEIWFFNMITCNGVELESPNLYQIWILGFPQLVFKMEVIELDLQRHLVIISTKKTTFNIAPVYWSRSAKGYFTPQTCSCIFTASLCQDSPCRHQATQQQCTLINQGILFTFTRRLVWTICPIPRPNGFGVDRTYYPCLWLVGRLRMAVLGV